MRDSRKETEKMKRNKRKKSRTYLEDKSRRIYFMFMKELNVRKIVDCEKSLVNFFHVIFFNFFSFARVVTAAHKRT